MLTFLTWSVTPEPSQDDWSSCREGQVGKTLLVGATLQGFGYPHIPQA